MSKLPLIFLASLLAVSGCANSPSASTADPVPAAGSPSQPAGEPAAKPPPLDANAEQIADRLGLDKAQLASLIATPLYQFSEDDVHLYLQYLHEAVPDPRDRVVHLARKNIGQPYELYLLGEFPFETYDDQPLYDLTKSDCVVFAEHTYAMALGEDWPAFFRLLQRIRYSDGEIGVATRNHYTEADWNPGNAWLVKDITREIGGEHALPFTQRVDRARFLKNRYQIDRDIPVEVIQEVYLPFEQVDLARPHLRDGDMFNIVTGRGDGRWVSHVGLVAIGENGAVNLIHSASPRVREESIDDFVRRNTARIAERDANGQSRFYGFKFLRLRSNPLANLAAVDSRGQTGPAVTPGIDVLLTSRRDLVDGKRIGLVTNPTGILADGRQNIDALHADPEIELAALFGPEHGVRGHYYAGDKVSAETDPATGVPVHSLYGATRKPKPEWLADLDVLVYDILDTGNRSYTFIYTMAYAMEAARDAGIPFVVCDRPNPLGGNLVDGNILDESQGTSFVGLYPIAYLYGMTPGELARYFNTEFGIGADLYVVEMEGWRRDMTFGDTGLPWVLPSQHVPRWETAWHLAITGTIGELHTINEGVGFTLPFEMAGAPWIDRDELAAELNSRGLPGLFFRPHTWVPRYGTHSGQTVQGVQIHITDAVAVRPVSAGIHLMHALQNQYPDQLPLGDETDEKSSGRISMFNKVMGTNAVRLDLLAGKSAEEIIASWQPAVDEFMAKRAKYLLYR